MEKKRACLVGCFFLERGSDTHTLNYSIHIVPCTRLSLGSILRRQVIKEIRHINPGSHPQNTFGDLLLICLDSGYRNKSGW